LLALWEALVRAAPSLADDEALAVLPVRAASAGDSRLILQRRSRLLLRLGESSVERVLALCGQRLEVAGAPVLLGAAKTRPLAHHATLYAHRVAADEDDEAAFVRQAAGDLDRLGVRAEFIVGKRSGARGPLSMLAGFSLIPELAPRQSLALQGAGLGAHRRLGFGIFVGHK
jgi:CRISPR-associated protein Cas6